MIIARAKREVVLMIKDAEAVSGMEVRIGADEIWSCVFEPGRVKLSRENITIYWSIEQTTELFNIMFVIDKDFSEKDENNEMD